MVTQSTREVNDLTSADDTSAFQRMSFVRILTRNPFDGIEGRSEYPERAPLPSPPSDGFGAENSAASVQKENVPPHDSELFYDLLKAWAAFLLAIVLGGLIFSWLELQHEQDTFAAATARRCQEAKARDAIVAGFRQAPPSPNPNPTH
jgi:hypothetical protein